MVWQGKRRKQLPSNWGAIRKQRLELDGYRCTAVVRSDGFTPVDGGRCVGDDGKDWAIFRCFARATDVDHHLGPHDHRLSSLRSLCDWHHKQKTQAEAKAAQALKSRARAKQPHPGLR